MAVKVIVKQNTVKVTAQQAKGTSSTIAVGTTTTGEAGTNAIVSNVGTATNAILNFVIPRGQNGESGETAAQIRDKLETLTSPNRLDITAIENAPTQYTDAMAQAANAAALGGKVDKIDGKGLSTNDLTDALKSGYDTAASDAHTHANMTALASVSGINTGDQALASTILLDYDFTNVGTGVEIDFTNLPFYNEYEITLTDLIGTTANVGQMFAKLYNATLSSYQSNSYSYTSLYASSGGSQLNRTTSNKATAFLNIGNQNVGASTNKKISETIRLKGMKNLEKIPCASYFFSEVASSSESSTISFGDATPSIVGNFTKLMIYKTDTSGTYPFSGHVCVKGIK